MIDKLLKPVRTLYKQANEFSWKIVFSYVCYKLAHRIVDFPKLANLLFVFRHAQVIKYLRNLFCKKTFNFNNELLEDKEVSLTFKKRVIWVMWWQGIKNMPETVRICYDNLVNISQDEYEIVLIEKSNYSKYIDLKPIIVERFESGSFGLTHFSDIIRWNLLHKYGGVWIDSTIFVTDVSVFDKGKRAFLSPALGTNTFENVSRSRWCGFFIISDSHTVMTRYMVNLFNLYWELQTVLVDYFLIDYLLAFAMEESDEIRHMIYQNPLNNSDIEYLNKVANKPFDSDDYVRIVKSKCHKLSWKVNYNLSVKGDLTFWGKFVEQQNVNN